MPGISVETIYCFSTQKTNTLCWLTSNQAVSLYPSDKLSKGGKRLPNVEIPATPPNPICTFSCSKDGASTLHRGFPFNLRIYMSRILSNMKSLMTEAYIFPENPPIRLILKLDRQLATKNNPHHFRRNL